MDRPTKQELLAAVRSFLEKDLLPELEGVRRFHARVSINALGIVLRELELSRERLLEVTQAEAFAPIYVRLAYQPS